MKKIQLFYIAFILLLFGGCTDEVSGVLDDSPINRDGSIAFRMDSVITRGTPQDNVLNYSKVNMIAYSHTGKYADGKSQYRRIDLTKDGSNTPPTWDYSPHMFWPEGRGLSFLGYTIESTFTYATATGKEGVFVKENGPTAAPTIEYIVPTDVGKQPDLIVTAQLDHPKSQNVTLIMKHALSCVSFCATAPLGANGKVMKVKSLKINNIYTKGTFLLDDPSIKWTLDPDSKTSQTFREPGIDPDKPLKPDDKIEEEQNKYNYLMTFDGYLMMLPQTLKDVTIDVIYELDGEKKSTTYNLPSDIVWEPGKKYIYKFGEDLEEVVVYYEKYADGTYGFHNEEANPRFNPLDDVKEIAEAGYGVLTKSTLVSKTPTLRLDKGNDISSTRVSVPGGYNLYAVSQTGNTFVLPADRAPVAVYFDGNNMPCGKIIPHFAKGVNDWNPSDNTYYIRTPQQMRNISALTTTGEFNASLAIYNQERDLDFSQTKSAIGGGALNGAVVDQLFSGTYNGKSMSISNVTINAPGSDCIGLFSISHGIHNDMVLKSASITGKAMVGGIVGQLYGVAGAINRPRVIGTSTSSTQMVTIGGVSSVGGIVGQNDGVILGNTAIEPATQITVAEVSGWVNISASDNSVGGIAGNNNKSIKTSLVHGVYVAGASFVDSKITITGGYSVGGIAGVNWKEIEGNITTSGKNMPDVAGLLEITGSSNIGGIAGVNAAGCTLNSVNIRSGRDMPTVIKGTSTNVGGIVGDNRGTLGVKNTSSFISARGNIQIIGLYNVGGIVGNNSSAAASLQNCFVYDFKNPTYYAPTIESTGDDPDVGGKVGGIVGTNNGSAIINCGVFSTSTKTIKIISAAKDAGGIAGFNASGSKTTNCSVIGSVEIEAKLGNSGGLFGSNGTGTTINSDCWIGSKDGKGLIEYAVDKLGLITSSPVGATYGTPSIIGTNYVGGIVGLNASVIENITIADNIKIGKEYGSELFSGSNNVGGIVGGNTPSYDGQNQSVVKNCKIENKTGIAISIQGSLTIGGIVGLNNGVVDNCHVSGINSTSQPKISGLGTIGGIIGQNGSHAVEKSTGNKYTSVRNCTVTGYAAITGHEVGYDTAIEVGGIIGLNGATEDLINNVFNCKVNGSAAGSITISVAGTTGGIAGKNSGNISQCDVQNANVYSVSGYAGGIAGLTISSANSTPTPPADGSATTNKLYRSDLKDCRIYNGVTIRGGSSYLPGALVGYINSSVTYILGSTNININSVNSTGVSVNGVQPTLNNLIWGYNTGDEGPGKATINHDVKPILPR